ncbi:MAG: ribonuclease HI family protein [candidate division KSB1 bacterium]|nr:ribonuclease HI family protein [candidate division KSB1 bacterium]
MSSLPEKEKGKIPGLLRLWRGFAQSVDIDAIASKMGCGRQEVESLLGAVEELLARNWGEERRCTIFVDGASRGNPGPSGIGVVIRDEEGEREWRVSEFIGEATNNVAEYRALLCGLRKAMELACTEVEVRSDSELLVKQLDGRYRVRDPKLVPLWKEAVTLMSQFRAVKIVHIPREENREADRLSVLAIDAARAEGLDAGG